MRGCRELKSRDVFHRGDYFIHVGERVEVDKMFWGKRVGKQKGFFRPIPISQELIEDAVIDPSVTQKVIGESFTTVNEKGGKQAFLKARFDLIPPIALRLLAQCLGFGAKKYGVNNWKLLSIEDQINHALNHLNEWNAGDRSEPHLVNAMARLSFALTQAVESGSQEANYVHPEEVG